MDWKDLYQKDPATLSETELKKLIDDIKDYRLNKTNCNQLSANECNVLLSLAHSEQSSRAADKLAKLSIKIAITSIIVSAVGIIIGVCI